MDKLPTILLVEDESPAVFAMEKYFKANGFSVLTAFSGEEGLKLALDNHPDILVLDVMMPAGSGLDILPELRNDPWGKTAKVLVFSNLSDDVHKAIANKFNVDAYLIKTSTSLKELTDKIRQVLGKQ